ncbi:MAG TPA: hypothetical protein VF086_18230 [Propionibacteriaceae bacterium]
MAPRVPASLAHWSFGRRIVRSTTNIRKTGPQPNEPALVNFGLLLAWIGHSLTAGHAFRLLAPPSQTTNRKLRDIAEELTQTRALPVQPATADRASIR